ncbi:MAG: DegT/DnrJ/EryC1/StrS family aminotransferase [Candidatus Spyradenecus sp.]
MKVFLSPPYMNDQAERDLVDQAFASNYIAPCGPMVDALEQAAADRFGFAGALATVSGTMALSLLARALEIGPGDTVVASDLTFIASVAPFATLGAQVVLVDSSPETWCIDPVLAEEALVRHPGAKALIATDLYGQSCDVDALAAVCARHGVKLIVDAAESVGATYRGRSAGKGAWAAIHSLNGNKIITSGGGGLLLSDDRELLALCRKLAGQAREPFPWYEHTRLGDHGRLGNIPAAIGLGQLQHLEAALRDKARVWEAWCRRFALRSWIHPMPTAGYGVPNRWLTVVTLEGLSPVAAVEQLAARGIEARPLWKPMHLQPVFRNAPTLLTGVGAKLFECGLCLPSGRGLEEGVMDEVLETLERMR